MRETMGRKRERLSSSREEERECERVSERVRGGLHLPQGEREASSEKSEGGASLRTRKREHREKEREREKVRKAL